MPKFSLRMPKYYDRAMHASMLVLLLFGSIMIVSTSVGESSESIRVVIMAIIKQIAFVTLSYFLMIFMAKNFAKFLSKETIVSKDPKKNKQRKMAFRGLFNTAGVVILAALAITLVMPAVNGSKAWIPLGFMTIQPSEFAKTYLILLLGITVNDYGSQKVKFSEYMKNPLIFYLAGVFIIFLQPDLGTLIIFTIITMTILLIPSNPSLDLLKKIIGVGFIIILVAMLFISTDFGISILENFNMDYKMGRIINAADPFKDIFGDGYNLVYSLYAIASGGITGQGLGGSKQKFGYLPEAQTDFIFSVTIEELGLLGLGIIVVCYGIILWRLCYYAVKTPSEGFKMILVGCALYLASHFVLNVGGVSALIPLTGVPLLFISSGGSSLLSIMILFGACQSIIALTRAQMRPMDTNRN